MKHEGWWRQIHMKLHHYFRNGKSLCGKHGMPTSGYDFPDTVPAHGERCERCFCSRLRERRELIPAASEFDDLDPYQGNNDDLHGLR